MTIYKGDYMNDLALTQVTMTSLELVDFINSQRKEGEAELRHSDFLEKVVKVLGLEMSENFRSSYKDSMNRQKPCYRFPKREACLMAMSYSYDLQAIVYDRMTALEEQQKKPKELSRLEILQMAIESEQKVLTLENQVNELTPKAKALDTLASGSQDLLCLTDAAKHLHISRDAFLTLLFNKKWIYRRKTSTQRKGAWAAYDTALRQGYLYHDYIEVEKPYGTDYSAQVLVTKKGMAHISQFLAEIEVTA